jgi:hypothetical protein
VLSGSDCGWVNPGLPILDLGKEQPALRYRTRALDLLGKSSDHRWCATVPYKHGAQTGERLLSGRQLAGSGDAAHDDGDSSNFSSTTARTTRPYRRKFTIALVGTPSAANALAALRWGDSDLLQMRLLFQKTSEFESTSRAITSSLIAASEERSRGRAIRWHRKRESCVGGLATWRT